MQLKDLSTGTWALICYGKPGQFKGCWRNQDGKTYVDDNVQAIDLGGYSEHTARFVSIMCEGFNEEAALLLVDGDAYEVHADGRVQKLMGSWRKVPKADAEFMVGWTEDTETGEVYSVY